MPRFRLDVLLLVLGVVLWQSSLPTQALWADRDISQQNTLSGGTLDAKLSEVGAGTEDSTLDEQQEDTLDSTWADLQHDPTTGNNDPVNNTLRINTTQSSIGAGRVNVTITYTESDGGLGTTGNANKTARTLVVETFNYQNTNLLGSKVTDENGNGHIDVEDLTLGETATNLTALPGIAAASTADLRIVIDGDRSLLSGVGTEDGVTLRFIIRSENTTFADGDLTQNNTIRYAS